MHILGGERGSGVPLAHCELENKAERWLLEGSGPGRGCFCSFPTSPGHCAVSQPHAATKGCHRPFPSETRTLSQYQTRGDFSLHSSSTISLSRNTLHRCQKKHVVALLLSTTTNFSFYKNFNESQHEKEQITAVMDCLLEAYKPDNSLQKPSETGVPSQ